MIILWLVTALWAFSFSLIGEYLASDIDAYIAVLIRMLFAGLLLLCFFRPHGLSPRRAAYLMTIGGIQIGLMYILLYHAFLYISVAEVLLFTIFTPLYITLIDEWLINRRRVPGRFWLAAILAVLGAAVIRYQQPGDMFWTGFLLIQGANLCFALGQVAYKRLPIHNHQQQRQVYFLFFAGAAVVSLIGTIGFADFTRVPMTLTHWLVLLWLGLVASGVGYLAWSMASKLVNIGQLATMNNMLIPAGLLVNFALWGEDVNWGRLVMGGCIIAMAVVLASRRPSPPISE